MKMLGCAMVAGVLAVIFAFVAIARMQERIDELARGVEVNQASINGVFHSLDGVQDDAGTAYDVAQEARKAVEDLTERFDSHRTSLDAHVRLPRRR